MSHIRFRIQAVCFLGAVYLAATALAVAGAAQIRRTLRARVSMPDGTLSHDVKARLENSLGEIIREGFTDSSGIFEVANLGIGDYVFTVPSDDSTYETATEHLDINRNSPDTIVLSIYLSAKKADSSASKRARTVSSKEVQIRVPKNAQRAYDRAAALSKKRKIQEAIKELEQAIALCPNYLQAYNDIALCYMKLDRLDEAVLSLQKAIDLDPKSFNPRLNMGIAQLRKQKLREAEPQLREALSIDSSSGLARMYLGILLGKIGRIEEAEDELLRALSLGGPDLAIAHCYLGRLYAASNRVPEAIDEMEAYLRERPLAEDAKRVRDELEDLRSRQK